MCLRFVLVAALALGVSDAGAKCIGKHGETILTDRRCEDSGGTWVGPARDPKPAAAEARVRAAESYASAKPAPERLSLVGRCQREWPTDYTMQKHCIDKQTEAAQILSLVNAKIKHIPEIAAVLERCGAQWADGETFDFVMVHHCYVKQVEAMAEVEAARRR